MTNILTLDGNLTSDPELRFTPSGHAVANFTVAHTPRRYDKQTDKWVDGETLFLRCSLWRDAAENVANSLTKGSKVLVSGRLVSRSWDDKASGDKRTVVELDVDDIGPSLRNATATVNKTTRSGAQGGGGGAFPATASASADPWATTPQPAKMTYDEPPF